MKSSLMCMVSGEFMRLKQPHHAQPNWSVPPLQLGSHPCNFQGLSMQQHPAHPYLHMLARQASACPSISTCGLLRLQLRMKASSALTPLLSTISLQQALL